ncbi:MAG: hypothetical protein K2L42_00110 [Clostridia bacterium]|nr:hypothetical protein [Clostridia bacterium]
MKFGKKSALALILAGVTALSITGCSNGVSSADEQYPEYDNNQYMWIGGWDPPINTEADYKLAAEMGLTHMFIDGVMAKRGTKAFTDQLVNCEKAGLKAIVGMDTSLANSDKVELDETDYSIYPAVDMINVWDEPYENVFSDVAARVERLNEIYDGKNITLYINGDMWHAKSPTELDATINYVNKLYDEVLSNINGRKILSTDIYPLLSSSDGNSLQTSWLYDMSCYADVTKEHRADGAEFHMFIQNYSSYGALVNQREIEDKSEFLFQVYTDMCFGVKGFSWFTYRKSFLDFGGGCVENDVSCKPTKYYQMAKEVNEEISKFDHVYLSFDWEGIMGVNGTINTADDPEYINPSFNFNTELEKLDCANKVSATQDTLIGQFKDKEGRAGLMVTNFTDPADKQKDVVSFEFKDANRAVVYRGGERMIYEVKDNKVDLKLSAGEGIFVIPVKV